MQQTIPTRSEADPRFTWDLTALYPSDDAWRENFAKAKESLNALRGFQGRFGEGAAVLLGYLRAYDDFLALAEPLVTYAFRKSDEDTRNATYQEMTSLTHNFLVEMEEATAFETPELLALPAETIDEYYRQEPGLAHYRLRLDRVLRKKAHTLSHAEEALLASAGKLSQIPSEAYGLLNNADMTFPDAVDAEGKAHPVTHGTFIPLMTSPDRTLRKSAFQALYGAYGQFRNTSASLLSGQMKQLQFFADARHYSSALEAALDNTEVAPEIYHNLIAAVHESFPSMHRYVRLRKKLLGVEKLHYYDLYTPIVADEDSKFSYEEGQKMALEALAPLGEDYLAMLKEGFANRWIDVYENQGKRSGAYSAGTYGAHPYVLLNYTDTLDDVFTLVHEMGHALHSYLSNQKQPITYADYVIFVAEVASTCNEALLMQHLLSKTDDPKRRAYLVNHFLEQFRTTLYRQTMFAEFELWCSERIRAGEALTAEALCQKYGDLNRQYYGEDIEPDTEIALEWARIPHFYYNFYVYQYATGFSCAIALSQKILKEGESAVKDYLNFLSGGCSTDPVSLLKGAGVDISTPAPVRQALQLFDQLITEMEQLAEN